MFRELAAQDEFQDMVLIFSVLLNQYISKYVYNVLTYSQSEGGAKM